MTQDLGLFVTGLEKSGKTPLRRLLGGQPWIELGRDRLWSRFDGRYGDLREPTALDACLAAISAAGIRFDQAIIRDRLAQGADALRTYAGLFGCIAQERARVAGCAVWGEQAAQIEAAADEVLAAFPDALIVHLVRDPRDRFCESRGSARLGGLGPAVASWLMSSERARTNQRRHPRAYRVIRYEDLVQRPSEVLSGISEALGHDAMVVAADEVPSAVTVGRYRAELPPESIDYIQRHSEAHMRHWGYGIEEVQLGRLDSLRSRVLDGPLRAARRRGWQQRERREPRTRQGHVGEGAGGA